LFSQEYCLLEKVRVPAYDAPGVVVGTAEPDRRPPKDGEERIGYRYLVEIHLPPKIRWMYAEELEPADDDGFPDNMVPANTP